MLDFCAKPVFGVMLIVGHWNINPRRMGLRIRAGEDPASEKHIAGQNDAVCSLEPGEGGPCSSQGDRISRLDKQYI